MSVEMSNELQQVELGLVMNVVNAITLCSLWHNSSGLPSDIIRQSLHKELNVAYFVKHKITKIRNDMTHPRSQELTWYTQFSLIVANEKKTDFPNLKIGMFKFCPEVIPGQKRGQNLFTVKEDQAVFNILLDE